MSNPKIILCGVDRTAMQRSAKPCKGVRLSHPAPFGDYMDIKLGPIQIFVSDIVKARKWYSEVLEMKLINKWEEGKEIIMMLGEVEFNIGTPNPVWGEGWDKVKIGGRTEISFETDNIQETWEKLKERDVKVIEELSKRSWGEFKATFADPDGNEFALVPKRKM